MTEPILVGEGPRGNRRVLILAGVAAAIVLAVVVLPGLLFGGGGGGVTPSVSPSPQGFGTTTTAPGAAAETFETFSRDNPFVPLVDTGAAPGADGGVTSGPADVPVTVPPGGLGGTDIGATTPGFDGGATQPPDAGSFGTSPTSTTTTAPPRQPDRIMLLEVFRDQSGRVVASVRVNDTTYQVGAGDDFARSYRVVSLDIDTRCGTFLLGDERFDMCEGDEVRK